MSWLLARFNPAGRGVRTPVDRCIDARRPAKTQLSRFKYFGYGELVPRAKDIEVILVAYSKAQHRLASSDMDPVERAWRAAFADENGGSRWGDSVADHTKLEAEPDDTDHRTCSSGPVRDGNRRCRGWANEAGRGGAPGIFADDDVYSGDDGEEDAQDYS